MKPFQIHGQATEEALEQCIAIIEAQGGKCYLVITEAQGCKCYYTSPRPQDQTIRPESIESAEEVHAKQR